MAVALAAALAAGCAGPAEQATRTRRMLVERYADTDTLVLGTHFPPPTAGRLARRSANTATFGTLG